MGDKKELSDYEYIDGELYLRAKSIIAAILGSPNFTDGGEEEFLEQDLGLEVRMEPCGYARHRTKHYDERIEQQITTQKIEKLTKLKCLVCGKTIPPWRRKNITCSKKCANAWNHLSRKEREKRRNKKYGK